jgi:hypothetical protein
VSSLFVWGRTSLYYFVSALSFPTFAVEMATKTNNKIYKYSMCQVCNRESFHLGAKFVLRFGGRGSKGGLCFAPQGGRARNNVPVVFGKCKSRKDVFRMTSSGALASVAFRGYYIRFTAGRLVMYRGARRAAKFKFGGGKIRVKSSRRGGRYMYVQSQGGARASAGMKVVARSRTSSSFMKFSCMSKYHV